MFLFVLKFQHPPEHPFVQKFQRFQKNHVFLMFLKNLMYQNLLELLFVQKFQKNL
jgi:hypothetical protein